MDCPKVLSQVEGPRSYQELRRVGDGAVGEGIVQRFAAAVSLQTSSDVRAVDGDFDNLCTVGRLSSCVWYPSEGGQEKEQETRLQASAAALGRHD